MADWANPTVASNYVTFVDEVKARDVDSITLQLNPLVSTPVGSIRLLRSPVKFQEWDGTKFVDKVLSPEGGGTGVTKISDLIPLLGLGSMAYQNSNSVGITGGGINNTTLNNTSMSGYVYFGGSNFNITTVTNNIALTVNGAAYQWNSIFSAPNTADGSHGVLIQAGTTRVDNAFYVRNATSAVIGFFVRGDMGVFCPTGLVIPVGGNKFVPA